ncbi:hypothetical protein [Corallococcus llansteffanensis]|uniref:Uncharacterized protein n=1 Tax=Corallococcus llansteffanensis TaxID=2316731 RepID=A0A3A8QH57_9BACT|nr:hypothetical protein [Corallococcus llansteffanensis]RKH67298.1 hypothetical protein D7V93_03250 [Corallococcus llansteffanensis]
MSPGGVHASRSPFAALVVASALACTRPAAAPQPPAELAPPAEPAKSAQPLVAPGIYNGRPPRHVGLLQLKVREDGTATLLHVVSAHLPPVELERREVRLERGAEGRVCMSPEPEALEPCLTLGADGGLNVRAREEDAEGLPVLLKREPSP